MFAGLMSRCTIPFACSGIVLQRFRQELQRDMAAQLEVFGLVDHTHAAATKLLHDAIVRDGLADHVEIISFRAGVCGEARRRN